MSAPRKQKYNPAKKINDAFASNLDGCLKERFSMDFKTEFNIFAFTYVTSRVDEKQITKPQSDFIEAWTQGYSQAMDTVTW